MMGTRERSLARLPPVSLEELVSPDHFYRHLERTLDFGFVRDWVSDLYADRGSPSIDPVGFFKLQLVMVFEAIRVGAWWPFRGRQGGSWPATRDYRSGRRPGHR